MILPMNAKEAKEIGLTPVEHAAEVCAAKISNWLTDELEKIDGDEADEQKYNQGGKMLFDPDYQGGGFSGEFSDDFWVVPLWLDGEVGQPSVWTAVTKAFVAGAKWQARRDKRGQRKRK